jgi:hypothetical protein
VEQDKRVWLIRLQEAASDLATSDLEEAATANDRRRAGVESARAAVAEFMAAVGAQILRDGAYR